MSTFICKNSWPTTDRAKQFLLFATRVQELVHPQAQDIYRVHATSTLGKLRELCSCCTEVMDGRYPKPTIEPVLLEVVECLESDIVVKRQIRNGRLPTGLERLNIQSSTETILSVARLWLELIEPKYEETLKSEIIDAVGSSKLKKKTLICAKLYVSHLLVRGENREFILASVHNIFFSKNIGQCTDALMNRFFECFQRKEKDHSIIFFGPKESFGLFSGDGTTKRAKSSKELTKILGFKVEFPKSIPKGNECVVLTKVSARNGFSAIKKVGLLLSLPRSFDVIYPSPDELEFSDICLAVETKSKEVTKISRKSLSAPVHSYTSQISYSKEMFNGFASYLWSVTRNDDHQTFLRLNRSLDAAGEALRSDSPTTQLVTLWSALEALLPPPTRDQKTVRVTHFVGLILPCVVRKYIRGKFRIFLDDVGRHSAGDLEDVLGKKTLRQDAPRKLAEILLENGAKCKEAFAEISDSPILLQRLFSLGKLISDPNLLIRKQRSHELRVEWQLHRIYRERNRLVHSGESSEYLPVLVENLFLYYRLVIRALQQVHKEFRIYQTDSSFELVYAMHSKRQSRLDELVRDTGSRSFHKSYLDELFSG